ncbi:MAG TPA: response regulator transcription factor [Thermoanaerobaculia bacterium]|nr:response regulator transcription factor [Thermoanaerobaculia bacterium]
MSDGLHRRILLVEDEESLILTLQDRLVSEGYDVTVARDGEAAVDAATRRMFDCILLDITLPRKNGFDVCRDLRQQNVQTPILMLTARGQVVDRVVGLKLGADDYVTKPFEMAELLARIEALLRRSRTLASNNASSYAFGEVEADFRSAEVRRRGTPVELSGLELKLLRYLVEHRGAVITRDELLEKVWGYGATPVTRTVDVHIASLRQKLEKNPARPEHIVTLHGLGYKFVG